MEKHKVQVQRHDSVCPHLPYVEQVAFLVVDQVCVEDQVAVSSIEVSVPLRVHGRKLQILNPPNLDTSNQNNTEPMMNTICCSTLSGRNTL